MDTTKVSIGELIAGASALALFIFMFLPWYGVEASASLPDGSDFSVSGANVNAWEAFSFIDILLFLASAAVIAIVVAKAADALPELPQPVGLILTAAGGLALALVLFRLLVIPGEDVSGFGVEVDLGRKIGIFFGLLASAGMAYGGWRAMNEPAAAAGSIGSGSSSAAPPPPATPAGGAHSTESHVPPTPEPPAPTPDPTPPVPTPDPVPPTTPPADPVPPTPPVPPEEPTPPDVDPPQRPSTGGQPPSGGGATY